MKTALVLGATGLVGSHLVDLLMSDDRFDKIKLLVRRSTGKAHPKLEEHIVNFDRPEQWQHVLTGDILFSAMGTTLKKAGSKGAQFKIDYTYQYVVAKAAATNGVPTYVLVSSAGASPQARFFYTRIKGELERDVQKLPFQTIHIIQPGILAGPRSERRTGERMGIGLLNVLHHIPGLGPYKPIHATIVAQAMINASFDTTQKVKRYTLQGVFDRAAQA